MAGREEIAGTVTFVTWPGTNNWAIVKLRSNGELIPAVGACERGSLVPNADYTFFGKWEDHQKYGRQFTFVQFTHREPQTRNGVVRYLAIHVPGVGPAIANALCDLYEPDEVIPLMKRDPVKVASVTKLSLDKAQKAAQVLKDLEHLQQTKVHLTDLLHGRGFPTKAYQAVLDKWGVRAPDVIRKDPFALLVNNIPGAGFMRCDRLYLDLGHPPEALRRQMFAVWAFMDEDMAGNTWYTAKDAADYLRAKVATQCQPAEAIAEGVKEGWLSTVTEHGIEYVTSAARAADEDDVMKYLIMTTEGSF